MCVCIYLFILIYLINIISVLGFIRDIDVSKQTLDIVTPISIQQMELVNCIHFMELRIRLVLFLIYLKDNLLL